LNTQKDSGRYQADFGFADSIYSNCRLNLSGSVELQTETLATQDGNGSDTASQTLYGNRGVGQRLDGTFTATMDTIEKVDIYIDTKVGSPTQMRVSIYDETSASTLGSAIVTSANITNNALVSFVFSAPIAITRGHIIQIRIDTDNTGGVGDYFTLLYTDSSVQSNAFYITTTDLWVNKTDQATYDLKYRVTYTTKQTSGTTTKTITPTDLDTWGNLKVTCANDDGNNSATVTIKDVSDNILIAATTLANGTNTVDLSTISVATYPSLKVVYTLARNAITNASIEISQHSVTFEGLSIKGWELIYNYTVPTDIASVSFLKLSSYRYIKVIFSVMASSTTARDLKVTFNNDATASYNKQHISGSSTTVAGVQSTGQNNISLTGALTSSDFGATFGCGEMNIQNKLSTHKKAVTFEYITAVSSAQDVKSYTGGGNWVNTLALIDTVTFTASGDSIESGSTFIVMGVR
jgi:hypothetical protein